MVRGGGLRSVASQGARVCPFSTKKTAFIPNREAVKKIGNLILYSG